MKDIIYVQVTVAALTSEIADCLIQVGYQHKSEISQNRVPLGEDVDPRQWAKLVFGQPPGQRRANIHVCIEGNPNQRYALLFRDYLRAHLNSACSTRVNQSRNFQTPCP